MLIGVKEKALPLKLSLETNLNAVPNVVTPPLKVIWLVLEKSSMSIIIFC